MKLRLTIASTLLLLAFHLPLHAQSYLRLPSNGAHWKVGEGYQDIFDIVSYGYFRETAGDTVVQGYPVIKVILPQYRQCRGLPYAPNTAMRFIHQDSLGRAFEIDLQGNARMLYDISLQVGDTLQLQDQGGQPLDYRVDSVDTVTYADNIPRKRLFLTCNDFLVSGPLAIWVEGIGDIYHGPFPVWEFENWQYNACYAENGLLLATGTGTECTVNIQDCYTMVGMDDAVGIHFTLSPQPARDALRLSTEVAQTVQVRLIALDGRLLQTWDLPHAADHTLHLPAHAPGLYLLELRNADGRIQAQRVVLE